MSNSSKTHSKVSKESLLQSYQSNLFFRLAKDQYTATLQDQFQALALAVRDRIVDHWIKTQQSYYHHNSKRVYYLSMEFLVGKLFDNYVVNLGLEQEIAQVLEELKLNPEDFRNQELDAGLGNGGLGRLAACFLESMATLGIPAHGYGIRYDYGIFQQRIKNGFQIERPDEWLRHGCPWEFAREENTVEIQFYGKLQDGQWIETDNVLAVPYDFPVIGYKNQVVNTLRLWSARGTEEFDLKYFNEGDYEQAVYQKIFSENISKILYPNDNMSQGKELRLKQEYFFSAAAISDIIRRYKSSNSDITQLADKVVIQLNDTHPSIAIVELLRVLIDEHALEWQTAWGIVQKTFAYTNHTLLPEALETWGVALLEKLLPRHLELIYQINHHLLEQVRQKFGDDHERISQMSLVQEQPEKRIRMANLAVVGAFSVNGVSELHSQLIKKRLFKYFHEYYPGKINNKTNGITQRQWLLKANPELATLITQSIGDSWIKNLENLRQLLPLSQEKAFRTAWSEIKASNKRRLAQFIQEQMQITVDPESMFDVQIKRIHEYKRQLLFAFYIIGQYLELKRDTKTLTSRRTFIIGGKAAPSYKMAKLIIKFINNVAQVINADEEIENKLKVIFIPDYRVSIAEKIFPASDLSEQISTAGMEASGTGNMKFMLNGAVTIGTLDGANIEMAEELGNKDIFIFGKTIEEIEKLKTGHYSSTDCIEQSDLLGQIIKCIQEDFFSPHEKGIFKPLLDSLLTDDPFFICADFDSYYKKQQDVNDVYQDRERWLDKSIKNTALAGKFSSDRTIAQYARDIWNVPLSHGQANND